ncbi:MAG: CopG family transcriptional regulator, partial [Pseudomonadota bacterium]
MNKKIIDYSDESIEANIIDDFLPSPDQLILKEETVKVTLSLDKKTVEFFKKQAECNDTGYQKMIRILL